MTTFSHIIYNEILRYTHGMFHAILDNIFRREMLKNGYASICGYAPTSPTILARLLT